MTHRMTIAGVTRDLPICKVTDDLYIGAFIMFGDAEITVACAKELLARAPKDYDYLLTAEAKSIPLIHEMARQSGAKTYFVARKGLKVYLTDPLCVDVNSITTQHEQHLYLSGADAALMRGKRILIVDDVISTGESLKALEKLVEEAGATVAGRMAVLAEGDAQERSDIVYLEKLPVFNADGTVKADAVVARRLPRRRGKDVAKRLYGDLTDDTMGRDTVNSVRTLAAVVGTEPCIAHERTVTHYMYLPPLQ